MSIKICSMCGEIKSLNDFGKNKLRPDGHKSACKACITKTRSPLKTKYGVTAEKYEQMRNAQKEDVRYVIDMKLRLVTGTGHLRV